MFAAVKGHIFNLFSCQAPGLSVCPLLVPAVVVANGLVFAGGFLGIIKMPPKPKGKKPQLSAKSSTAKTTHQKKSVRVMITCLTIDAMATAHALLSNSTVVLFK